ncbi:hypothetical protein IIA16_05135 [bacterium]|nr:hypothetical protein [bacterium]
MARMVRKQIYIKVRQERLLKRLAAETGMAEAEIVREAIDLQAEAVAAPRRALPWRRQVAYIEGLLAAGPVAGGRSMDARGPP